MNRLATSFGEGLVLSHSTVSAIDFLMPFTRSQMSVNSFLMSNQYGRFSEDNTNNHGLRSMTFLETFMDYYLMDRGPKRLKVKLSGHRDYVDVQQHNPAMYG